MDIRFVNSMFNHIYMFNANKAENMSFRAWHERTRQSRDALMELRKEIDAELDGMADTWAVVVIAKKRREENEAFDTVAANATKRIMDDLEKIIAAKEQRFSDAMGDPGGEAVNILGLLNMRQNISVADLAAVVPKLSGSLLALQTLADIAKRNNIPFPALPDKGEFDNDVAEIRSFAERMISETLTMPIDDQTYSQRLFWTSDPPFAGMIQEKMDHLDSPSFLQIDVDEIGKEAVTATKDGADGQKVYTRLTLNGSEWMDVIARQFDTTVEAIEQLNPGATRNPTSNGQTILVPGTLKFPEHGTGHVSADSHKMEVVPAPVAE